MRSRNLKDTCPGKHLQPNTSLHSRPAYLQGICFKTLRELLISKKINMLFICIRMKKFNLWIMPTFTYLNQERVVRWSLSKIKDGCVGLVWWHINYCRLFNDKSLIYYIYIYIYIYIYTTKKPFKIAHIFCHDIYFSRPYIFFKC